MALAAIVLPELFCLKGLFMKEETKHMKLAYWTGMVKEANNSGMKIRDWCEMNNITNRQYYYWHSKVMKSTYALAVKSGVLPDTGTSSPCLELPEVPDFKELIVPDADTRQCPRKDTGIRIGWEGFTIDMDPDFSEDELLKVLRVMHNVK